MRHKYNFRIKLNAEEFKKKLKVKDGKDAVIDYEKLSQELLPQIRQPEDGEDAEFTEEIKKEIVDAVLRKFKKEYDPKFKKEIEDAVREATKNIKPVVINQSGGDWGAPFEIPIKAGLNITVTKDASGAYVISSTASGGGLAKETPTGTIDDSNVTFTVTNEPFFINVNGAIYEVGDGLYASYVAGTITLTFPVGTGGFIKSYYTP